MESEKLNELLCWWDNNYNLIADYNLLRRKIIGDKNNKKCRFCGKTEPEVTFKDIAHAIPASLNNKYLFSYYECDSCNHKFGDTIEDQLNKYLFPQRLASIILGRKGKITYKEDDLNRIEVTDGNWKVQETFPHFITRIYVGSSNLSKGGLANNTEINLGFKSEENPDVFKELKDLFDYYWIRAKHLSSEELNIFKSIMKDKPGEPPEFSRRITDELGDYGIDNTTLLQSGNDSKEQAEQQKLKEFINDFKRNYGNYVASFNIVREIYTETEERKWPNIPIRIEVDRFLWWLGEVKYKKEEWKIGQFYNKEKQREIINALKPEFLLETKRFKDDSTDNYFILNDKFGSKDQINSLSEDELFDLLYINIYAFGTHAQYEGGKDGLKVALYENNSIADIKKSLIYLLHGSDNYILRLYQCIKGKYSLKVFGEHSVKELYGYVNNEDNPTYNGRIQKSMSWLGFGIL